MSQDTWSLDTDSKRWLVVLAAACVVAMVMLVHTFMKALSPAEQNSATAQKSAAAAADQAPNSGEPAWSSIQQVVSTENREAANRVSPFDGKNKLLTKKDEMVAQQEEVHRQADYLRKLIAADKLPAGLGHLTKEQVDEMEQKGETIQ